MNNKRTSRSKHIDFILLDLILVELSFMLAHYIRFGRLGGRIEEYQWLNLVILFAHLAIAFLSEGYSGILRRGYIDEGKKVLWHNLELLAVILATLYINKNSSEYSRILIFLFFGIDVIIMYTGRSLWKIFIHKRKKGKWHNSYMLVAVTKENVVDTIAKFKEMNYSAIRISGIVVLDEDMTGKEILGVPVVSDKAGMFEYIKSNVIDEVFLEYIGEETNDIANSILAMGAEVHTSINMLLKDMPNMTVQNIGKFTVITSAVNRISTRQLVIKRLIDICAALVGIVILIPLVIIFGPIIYIQSPGPIFFKQERVGKNGRPFKIYKLRSMYMDAEERKKELMAQNKMNGLMFKMDDDPRITPIGKFIRKTSIDEFPQFINILIGNMSLVGTRPPTMDEYLQYEQHHKSRLAMKPGLTGMWQVSGRSDITDFEEIVRLDNEYIRNFSLGLDIKIICKTIVAVLKHEGSV